MPAVRMVGILSHPRRISQAFFAVILSNTWVPIEAESAKDHVSKTQVQQAIDFALERYPKLILRPVGIQEIRDQSLVLIEFTSKGSHPDQIKIVEMRRYKLVPMSEVPLNELQSRA